MNTNQVQLKGWSNDDSRALYEQNWPNEPAMREQHERGDQCGACAFYAKSDLDWGLCCHVASRHHLETVFEHFTCPSYSGEGWGPHSFDANPKAHCWCRGIPKELYSRMEKGETIVLTRDDLNKLYGMDESSSE